MKSSTHRWFSVGAVMGCALLAATAPAGANLVAGVRCGAAPAPTPAPAPMPTPPFECREIIIRVEFPQGIVLPEPPSCPECYGIELIDIRALLEAPIPQVFELPEGWKASSDRSSRPVPGVVDDPNIPNLTLRYVGSREILGPADVGTIKLRAPFVLPPSVQYIGHAWDTRTRKGVTNVGVLSLDAASAHPSRRRTFVIGVVVLAAIAGGAVLFYLSRRSGRLG